MPRNGMSGNRLLVIDDEAPFAQFVERVGRKLGFEVETTDRADRFRSTLERWNPSLVVMDLNMPEVDGIELLRELGDKGCPAHILIASGIDGRTLETTRRMAEETGLRVAGTIQKPVRAPDLRSILGSLVDPTVTVTAERLRLGIENDELFLLFQPKIDLATGRLVGVESLVRWRTSDGSLIGPDVFVPIAEKEGGIEELTAWVARHAIAQAAEWHAKNLPLQVAVNISAHNIRDRRLPDKLARLCMEAGTAPSRFTLELTETAAMQDAAMLMEVLGRFRLKGFRASIDDFGTGYSSLTQLVRLPFSEIKIDQSFIREMHQARDSAVIAKAIIDLGHNLGLEAVAEGVEDERAVTMLLDMGCDIAQGYHYARPLPADEIPPFAERFGRSLREAGE